MKKYEFTGEVNDAGLRRIKRLSNGEIGGWIEGEKNLSHQGNAWVYGNAQVYGSAQVYGNAWVYGNARVSGRTQVYGSARVSDNAQVYGNTQVYGSAQVSDNAQVYGNTQVYGNARVFGPIKTATRTDSWTFSLLPCADGVWRVSAGCRFFTLDEAWQHWRHGERANTPLGLESEDILVLFEHYIQRQPPLPV